MYELTWKNNKIWKDLANIDNYRSSIERDYIDTVLMLKWEEHCVECAAPDCYRSCEIYKARRDGRCARFEYGIFPNKYFEGLYNFGADITFRKWGKLEAEIHESFPSPKLPHSILRLYDKLSDKIKGKIMWQFKKYWKKKKLRFDEFILECYSANTSAKNLILEYFDIVNQKKVLAYKTSIKLSNGYNLVRIPYENFNIQNEIGYLSIYPEDVNIEMRLIFTWLDFVKYKVKHTNRDTRKIVKCVVWDLDNTLWDGILNENNPIILNNEAVALIRDLDNLGIIQTIISKNNQQHALAKLKEYNIDNYFINPSINWEQKSKNLSNIAKQLNISLENFLVIDDSEFERAEIEAVHPQIQVFSNNELELVKKTVNQSLSYNSLGKNRRESYNLELKRREEMTNFLGTYSQFLKTCKIEIDLIIPQSVQDIKRCLELMQRSNQLNLSTRRYSESDLLALLHSTNIISIAVKCRDKFGDYGIIGFSSISLKDDNPIIEDMLFSCRAAQKKIEHAFINWLAVELKEMNYKELKAILIETDKNFPIRQVFNDLPFQMITKKDKFITYSVNLSQWLIIDEIIKVKSAFTIKDLINKNHF